MARVEFDRVSKTFAGGATALDALSLDIADGELMVLVGPSGCGKSTALRVLAGLETPTGGDIRIDARSVLAQSPRQRNIAMVFQNYALYPHMTVFDNLAFPLRMARQAHADIEARVRAVAQTLELDALLHRKPAALSGGQRQRVAMGRAMVREPEVFLLDEPLSNLDARLRTQVRTWIAALQRRLQTTMIYVTHDQAEAMTLGQRVAVLYAGRLQQVGAPQALYERPANRFVAGFLGSPPMNLFEVRIDSTVDGLVLSGADTPVPLPAAWTATLGSRHGQPVHMGLRPEAFRIVDVPDPALPRLLLEVIAEERLGHERLVYCASPWPSLDAAGQPQDPSQLIVRAAAGPALQCGSRVTVEVDVEQLHVFDRDGVSLRCETWRCNAITGVNDAPGFD